MSKAVPAKKPRGRFFHEVVLELRKVRWPSREDVTNLTLVVLFTILGVGAYVFIIDWVLLKLFTLIGLYGR